MRTTGTHGPIPTPWYVWQRWPHWLKLAIFPLSYFGAAELGTVLTFKPHEFLSIWLPSGVFLAYLLGCPKRDWPWLFVLVFPASIAFNSLEGKSWQICCLFTLINCIESFSAALLVRKFVGPFHQLRSVRELALIVLIGAVLCTAVGGLLAASLISFLGGAGHFWENWALWTGAVSLGVMLLTPLLLAWLGTETDTVDWQRRGWRLEATLLLLCLVGSSVLGFTHFWRQGLSMEYLPLPFLIWAAFRFGLKGVTLANGLVCLLAAWLNVRSFEELQVASISPYLYVAQLQLLLVVIVFVGLIPSVMLVTLRLSEERQTAMIDKISDVIAIIDINGLITFKSRNVERVFGWKPEELRGKTWKVNVHPDDLPEVLGHFCALTRSPGASVTLYFRYRCRDGSYLPVELTAVNQLHDTNLRGVLVNYHDDSVRRAAEEQLRQAQKMEAVGQLAGGIAHDFNNILASMMLNLDLMKMDERLPKDLRESLSEQEREARRAAALTRQLLLFGRRQMITLKPMELNETLSNVLGMIRRIIGETIRIEVSSGCPDLWIHADAGMIDQIIMNLCVNARDAMPQGGVITIRTERIAVDSLAGHQAEGARLGDFVRIQIKDTGLGMSPEVLRHAFEPFFTTKAVGKGTGLGLATVHGIVQQHNGWIEVMTAPGAGTEFSIYLPASQRTDQGAHDAPASTSLRGGNETILVVEDEEGLRAGICTRLSRLGYRVLEASNAQEALQLWSAQAACIDLLFTDMVMTQGMSGQELGAAFRNLKPGLKVIISSGYSQDLLRTGGTQQAGLVYLPKPYSGDVMTSLIRSQLDS